MAKEDPIRFEQQGCAEHGEESCDLSLLVRQFNQAPSIVTVLVHRFGGNLDSCFRNDEEVHVWMATQALLELIRSAAANALEAPNNAFGIDVATTLYKCEGLLHLLESERASQDTVPNFPDAVLRGYFQSVMDLISQALGAVDASHTEATVG